ncbi:hypothetical protein HMPREF1210_00815, partial [Paenisporosarcina sp. HGH0030]
MKKMLLGLTMGAMVFSFSQGTTAEASFSSNQPTCLTNTSYDWSTRTLVKPVANSAMEKQLIDQLYAQLFAAGFKVPTQKPAVPAKPAVP